MRVRTRLVALFVGIGATLPCAGAAYGYSDTYVALGDSYSSGTGTRSYFNEECERSSYSYPSLLARDWPRKPPKASGALTWNFTCGGATTSDVLGDQVPLIPYNTSYVTITIGGNDAGFGDVIKQCAKPWPTTCWGDIEEAQEFIREDLPARLSTVYRGIRQRATMAHVIVVGYPHLFGPQECNGAARISEGEQEELNETADVLRDTTRTMTAAAGAAFYFADAIPQFSGHAVCSGDEWLNGVSNPVGESFHPNRDGHLQGYLPLVRSAIVATG
jgi:lysophospholipase L1-like esterase